MATVDFNALFNQMANAEIMKDKKLRPLFKVLNKHGIYGLEALTFMTELTAAIQESEVDTDDQNAG